MASHLSIAGGHSTPGSCKSSRTVLVGTSRASKYIEHIVAIYEVSRQLGTPWTEVLIEA